MTDVLARLKEKGMRGGFTCLLYGGPGTGKTEVARIISRILYDAGVLAETKIVETDAQGLLGQYVGQTAPKTLDKINEAIHSSISAGTMALYFGKKQEAAAAAS